MNKSIFLLVGTLLSVIKMLVAQDNSAKIPRIALFAPLYLDSAFDASGNYRFGKTVPKYISSGLDFYQGAELAFDSLDKEGVKLNVKVYDTKNARGTIFKVADSGLLDSVDLILGAVSGSEFIDLATIAKEKKIPFVSATYPNDGGISTNPYVIIVSSKLNTHLQATYNYVLRSLGTNKITMFRRQNGADDRVAEVYKSLNTSASGPVLNMQTITLNNPFIATDIAASLDSSRENVIICGSLDDNFGKSLISYTSSLSSSYKITLVGMPTWEDFRELSLPELKNVSVIYSANFFNPGTPDSWSTSFIKNYTLETYSNPTENAFRGFELTYYFAHLTAKYHSELLNNITEKSYRVLTDFDFRPIHWTKNSTIPDYYENKRIYILKQLNGTTVKVN